MDFIIDRSSSDVLRWKNLHDKGWDNMSADEQTEWMGQMKGRYTHADMNRVENAVEALSRVLEELGYKHPTLSIKTDWTVADLPTRDDMVRYFGNVNVLKQSMPVYSTTPNAPTVAQKLDYNKANDLEKILFDVDKITTGIKSIWCYAGEIFAGEV